MAGGSASPPRPLPLVSMFLAVRNEERHLSLCLDGFLRQTYPHERTEIVVAISGDDATREIARTYAAAHPGWLRWCENTHGGIAQGLNISLKASKGDILALYIGHAVPAPSYVERVVAALQREDIDYVGGRVVPTAMTDGRQEQAIALALRQPFAVGGNAYTWKRQRPARFTHWMAARREWTDRVGLFDETLQRGEDCDWYERLAEAGAKGWFDPSMCSMYYVRPDYRSSFCYAVRNAYHRLLLARQTGRGLSWRHAIPGILAIGALLGLAIPMSRILVYAGVLLYSVALCWSSWRAAEGGRSLMPWIAGAILVHHSGHVIGLVGGAVWMGWRRPPRTP